MVNSGSHDGEAVALATLGGDDSPDAQLLHLGASGADATRCYYSVVTGEP